MTHIRYAAAACQTDLPNPTDRADDGREHRPDAVDDRLGGRGERAVSPRAAGRVPGVRARRAGVCDGGRAARAPRGTDPQRAYRPPRAQSAGTSDLHPERIDDRGRFALATRRVQHDVPDWAGGSALQVPEGQPVDPLRSAFQPARSGGIRRAAVSGRGDARSAGSAARSATTGCSRKPSGSSPRMAPRCSCASRHTWTRGARPSR